jgi:hypothetical protein
VKNVFTRLYHFEKVEKALEQPIVHSLLELQSQAYVHMLAIVLLIAMYVGSLASAAIANDSFKIVVDRFDDPVNMLVAGAVLVAIGFGIYIWIGPATSHLGLLESYTCTTRQADGRCADINASVTFPPNNIVTYGRMAITYAALLATHIPITAMSKKPEWKKFCVITALAGGIAGFYAFFR